MKLSCFIIAGKDSGVVSETAPPQYDAGNEAEIDDAEMAENQEPEAVPAAEEDAETEVPDEDVSELDEADEGAAEEVVDEPVDEEE